jgi:hypothetical protein
LEHSITPLKTDSFKEEINVTSVKYLRSAEESISFEKEVK